MRLLVLSAIVFASPAFAAGRLTVVFSFQEPPSSPTVAEMQREVQTIFKDSGLTFDWRQRGDTDGESFDNVVLVRFKGKCVVDPVAYPYDERGPFAFTYSTGGVPQPFAEVSCDKVTASVRSAMFGGDFAHADILLGRALGRVVAHEVRHILAGNGNHEQAGVFRRALTGVDLITADPPHK